MNFDIPKIFDEIDVEGNKFKYLDNGLILTNFEIQTLEKYSICYKNCSSLKDILFLIEQIIQEENYKDLEEISLKIAERDYYINTNK